MTTDSHGRGARRPSRAAVTDVLAALALLALLGWLELHTPAYTDFEMEGEPAVQALLSGHLRTAVELMPVYGASFFFEAPFAWLAKLLGGGDIAVYRTLAISGALGIAALAVYAARQLRLQGRARRTQLLTVALIATSPAIALAWMYGHHEEVLVAAAAVAGIVAVTGGTRRHWIAGGVLVGLAAGAKMSAVIAIPVAMAAAIGLRAALTVGVSAAASGLAVFGPLLVVKAGEIGAHAVAAGSDGIYKPGNLFWWFAGRNPDFRAPSDAVPYTGYETVGIRYARLPPDFVADHAHELIVVLGALLAAVWWLRHRNFGTAGGAGVPTASKRAAVLSSALLLLAAAVWWRALIDPWFQAYYLTPALLAIGLSEAVRGRPPIATGVASAALWLTWGEFAPVAGWSPDALTAVSHLWMIPFGVWLTISALRGPHAAGVTPAGQGTPRGAATPGLRRDTEPAPVA